MEVSISSVCGYGDVLVAIVVVAKCSRALLHI